MATSQSTMSSTTPSKTIQAADIRAYRSKTERLLQNIERDVAALEAHIRAGPTFSHPDPFPWLSPLRPSSPEREYIPPGPTLSPPARFSSTGMPLPQPMYTGPIAMMPSVYCPSPLKGSEAYRQMEQKYPRGGVNVGDGDGEIYDPAHPLIEHGSNASKLYDFERYRHQSAEVDPVREIESELEYKIETENQNVEMEVEEYEGEKVQSSEKPSRVSIETGTRDEANDQQRETIEDSPVNPTSEKFWGQLFSKENQPNNAARVESVEQHGNKFKDHLDSQDDNIETLSNQAFSPFERSPAPGIPSPRTDSLAKPESELHQGQTELMSTAGQEMGGSQEAEELANPIGLEGLDSGDGENRYNGLFEEAGMQDDVYPGADDENAFWDGSSVPTDLGTDAAMQSMEDEYAVMLDEDGEVSLLMDDDDGFDEEEDDFMDSE
ncbi:hypothetical protein BKA61DRAFT_612330 [Leptodontidium sp. MPI-SDFR-AT-0119]|nr:hypothetical protein BKA61DRAFT_612330 [Leptodontidium sp. MPI-SDFR-AT-0119]